MNINRLSAPGEKGPELAYLQEVARRLSPALGESLNQQEAIALMNIVTLYTFEMEDGFIINDVSDLVKQIGDTEAAALAAAFCSEPDKDWSWWKAEYPSFNMNSKRYQRALESILSRIVMYPAVRRTWR